MLNTLTNVVKAGVAVIASPIAVAADICTLLGTAYDGKPAFGKTAKLLNAAGDCMAEATKPTKERSNG